MTAIYRDVSSSRLRPWGIGEGAFLGGFCVYDGLALGQGIVDLSRARPATGPWQEKYAKVIAAAKTALVNLFSLGGSIGSLAVWAHESRVFSLGRSVPFVRVCGYGASLAINLLEGAHSIYRIYTEHSAMRKELSLTQRDKHKQRIGLELMRLVKSVSMVAWVVLSAVSFVAGLAVSSILTTSLLALGMIFSVAAYAYQRHIEKGRTEVDVIQSRVEG